MNQQQALFDNYARYDKMSYVKVIKQNILLAIIAVFFIGLLVPMMVSSVAYADIDSMQERVDELNNQVNDVQKKVDEAKGRLTDAQNRYENVKKKIDESLTTYSSALKIIHNYQTNLDEVSDKSFAAAFGLAVARTQIPNELVNDDVFYWQLRSVLMDAEKKNVDSFVDYYYKICNVYDLYDKYSQQAQAELDNINNEITNLENIYTSASNELSSSGPELARLKELKEKYSYGDGLYKGIFCHPCPGRGAISDSFGADRGDYYHKGVDFSASTGTPIYAAADGTVIYSYGGGDYNQGYGNCVWISHGNGLVTKYFHCSSVLVGEGEHVSRGQNIALVGSTGDSTGSHLHFQVEQNGRPIDPIPLIDQ